MNELTLKAFRVAYTLGTEYFVPTFAVILGVICWQFVASGQPIAAATFAGFGAVLVAGEAASVYFTKKTISENIWLWSVANPDKAMTTIMLFILLTIIIGIHLLKIPIGAWLGEQTPVE